MLLDGKKVACATCIKGHRATHCKHKDRLMVEIKKIGRPATQCERCRTLRLVRQLHVKCNCSDERQLKRPRITHEDRDKKKRAMGNLRAIAPRQNDTMEDHQQQQPLPATIPSPSKSCCSSSSPTMPPPQDQSLPDVIQPPNNKLSSSPQGTTGSTCCGSSRPTAETSPPPSSTCCPSSTTQRNALGQPIRLVTCRCGDACTCIGCDAHPARAMKSYHHHHNNSHDQPQHDDPYAGYSGFSLGRRGLSIAAICQPSSNPPSPSTTSSSSSSLSSPHDLEQHTPNTSDDRPTSVLAENGAMFCGCGCSHALDQCTDCFEELCQDYFASR